MILKGTNFDHSKQTFLDAIKVPVHVRNKCRERIIFASAANYLQASRLFDSEHDAPAEFHTKTGDFARTLSLITDQLEYEYTLLVFSSLYDIVMLGIAGHRALNDPETSEFNKARLTLSMEREELELKAKIHDKVDQLDEKESEYVREAMLEAQAVLPSSINKRVELTKQSSYNWDTYFNMVSRTNYFPKNDGFDVDGLLSGLFKND